MLITKALPPLKYMNMPTLSHTDITLSRPSRMTFKMYAVDFCELLLYDEQKQAYHMMLSSFQKKDALKAFIQ